MENKGSRKVILTTGLPVANPYFWLGADDVMESLVFIISVWEQLIITKWSKSAIFLDVEETMTLKIKYEFIGLPWMKKNEIVG